jgi:hypothetical protein
MHERRMGTYLNDRYALAVAGEELAGRAKSSNKNTDYAELFARAERDLQTDRDLLERLMAEHGAKPDRLKSGAAWVGEKLGRLKPNDAIVRYSPLSRVVELDGLTAIVSVLDGSWAALDHVLGGEQPELKAARERARRTLHELSLLRPQAARDALS